MGIAGPGIFDDDSACDVRYVWREALMDGLDSEAATARVFEQMGDMLTTRTTTASSPGSPSQRRSRRPGAFSPR